MSSDVEMLEFDAQMRRNDLGRRRLARDLRAGLKRGEIEAFYQPQLDVTSRAVTGFEALARWRHPRNGLLSPGAFLGLARETGMDEPLGDQMIRQALDAMSTWAQAGHPMSSVGVNVAESQLSNPKFADLVKWELDRSGVPPEKLAIEVLETVYVEDDNDQVVRTVSALADLGVAIDLDDFGTGAASITGIRRYRASRVKIDRSYIRYLHEDAQNQTLVRSIANMANGLGVSVLAEGVETQDELTAAVDLGCAYLQGFGIARPMTLEDSLEWLERFDAADLFPNASAKAS